MTNGDRIYKCRALVGTTRCTFKGVNDALADVRAALSAVGGEVKPK